VHQPHASRWVHQLPVSERATQWSDGQRKCGCVNTGRDTGPRRHTRHRRPRRRPVRRRRGDRWTRTPAIGSSRSRAGAQRLTSITSSRWPIPDRRGRSSSSTSASISQTTRSTCSRSTAVRIAAWGRRRCHLPAAVAHGRRTVSAAPLRGPARRCQRGIGGARPGGVAGDGVLGPDRCGPHQDDATSAGAGTRFS
jgi:hypothetical protein